VSTCTERQPRTMGTPRPYSLNTPAQIFLVERFSDSGRRQRAIARYDASLCRAEWCYEAPVCYAAAGPNGLIHPSWTSPSHERGDRGTLRCKMAAAYGQVQ